MRRDPWSLVNVLLLAGIVAVLLGGWVFSALDGWTYYSTPLRVRGYAVQHRVLRPSGLVAHPLGVIGAALLMVPVGYTVRKRWARLSRAGSMRAWLEVHILCGIVGPVLVTFHSAFRFNGVIAVAYWSMIAVMLSGFVGRYLYVRIPKTIRGVELTNEEIQARAAGLTRHLAESGLRQEVLVRLEGSQPVSRWQRWRLRRALTAERIDPRVVRDVTATFTERALLLRRLRYLNRTKHLFAMWHVFHQPLVYLMFAIAAAHVAVALYFGYSWW